MIKRDIEEKILNSAKTYGVISITGPRQSGKTTVAKALFPNHKYINFENLVDLNLIKQDPINFINSIEEGVIIDEVQKYPEILSFIQVSIDQNYKPGKFILTGSQNLLLLDKVNQSLAGRVSIIQLLPLSINELNNASKTEKDYVSQILKGFYPGIYDKGFEISEYYQNYINTYVERDVRTIQNIGNLSQFSSFVQLLATRIGQLVNYSDIASALGVSHNTIASWISILEASYIIFLLQPFHENFGKRLVKSPKIYFTDVGLASHLLRLDNVNEVSNYYNLGSLFENLVIIDIYKKILNNNSSTKLYFYRDSNGAEIDLLLDRGLQIEPFEIKSSQSFNSDFLKGIKYYKTLSTKAFGGALIYTGEEKWEVDTINIYNYKDLNKIKV